MRRLILALGALLIAAPALAQSVPLQAGPWTPGHAPMYSSSGQSQPIIQDSGTAGGGAVGIGLSEFLQVSRAGNGATTAPFANSGSGPQNTHACFYDAPVTNATGYHYLCLDANAQGGGLLSYGPGGGAPALPFQFIINGISFSPASGFISIPASSITGQVSVAQGGTGQSTANAGFNALSPMTTAGDMIYGGLSGSGTRLPVGTNSQILVGGTIPSWGNVPAAALPFPTASTLGGVESLTCSANNWFTGLTTGGLFTCSQPAFSNLSGQATLAQLPSISQNTLLGSVTAGTNPPAALTGLQAEGMLQFLAPGSGAAQRSLNTKVADWLNGADYGASGSTQTTTGSITAGTTSLTLTSALDFQNGQYVRVNGAGATFSVNQATGVSVVQNGTTGAAHYQYQVSTLDATCGVGVPPAATAIVNGNATLSATNSITVSWTAPASGPTPAGYVVWGKVSGTMTPLQIVRGSTSWTDVGTTTIPTGDWIPASPPALALNDCLVAKITSGAGTTGLTLGTSASNTVSGATADHDDLTAIQTAINALPAAGGIVALNPGTYQFCCGTLNLGNGVAGAASTTSGMRLKGLASGGGSTGVAGTAPFEAVNFQCTWIGVCVQVNGPLSGWEIDDITIQIAVGSTNSFGLLLQSASYGNTNRLQISGSYNFSLVDTLVTSAKSAESNSFYDTQIFLPTNAPNASGVRISSGFAANDNFKESFYSLKVLPSLSSQTCLTLGATDSDWFSDFWCNPAAGGGNANAIVFDYSTNNSWPSGMIFNKLETWTNTITNNSTPGSTLEPNRVFGFSRVNGATVPTLANLAVMDYYNSSGAAPTLGTGCNGAGSSIITGSTNNAGQAVTQTTAGTSCVLTFANPGFPANGPLCVFQGFQTAPLINAANSTSVTITYTSTANLRFNWLCQGW